MIWVCKRVPSKSLKNCNLFQRNRRDFGVLISLQFNRSEVPHSLRLLVKNSNLKILNVFGKWIINTFSCRLLVVAFLWLQAVLCCWLESWNPYFNLRFGGGKVVWSFKAVTLIWIIPTLQKLSVMHQSFLFPNTVQEKTRNSHFSYSWKILLLFWLFVKDEQHVS